MVVLSLFVEFFTLFLALFVGNINPHIQSVERYSMPLTLEHQKRRIITQDTPPGKKKRDTEKVKKK